MGYRPCNIDAEFLATCSAALSSSWKTLHENLGSVQQSTQTPQTKRPRCFQDQPLLISCCYWPFAQTTDDVILPWRTLPSAQESTLRMKNKAGMKWKKIKITATESLPLSWYQYCKLASWRMHVTISGAWQQCLEDLLHYSESPTSTRALPLSI